MSYTPVVYGSVVTEQQLLTAVDYFLRSMGFQKVADLSQYDMNLSVVAGCALAQQSNQSPYAARLTIGPFDVVNVTTAGAMGAAIIAVVDVAFGVAAQVPLTLGYSYRVQLIGSTYVSGIPLVELASTYNCSALITAASLYGTPNVVCF